MANVAVKSIWDDDTPATLRERVTKGLAAWERANSVDDEAAQLSELRDAYSHFRMAAREARRTRYAEILYFGNLTALMTGEVSKWPERLKAARQAYEASWDRNDWLLPLFGTVVEDICSIKLAPSRAREQLWEDAHKHTDTSYGLALFGSFLGQMVYMPPALKRQYDGLARHMAGQVAENLLDLADLDSPETGSHESLMPLAVEAVADAMSEEEASRKYAAQLYKALLALPDEVWSRAQSAESHRSPEEHREHVEARLELVTRRARGSGCGVAALGLAAFIVLAGTARLARS